MCLWQARACLLERTRPGARGGGAPKSPGGEDGEDRLGCGPGCRRAGGGEGQDNAACTKINGRIDRAPTDALESNERGELGTHNNNHREEAQTEDDAG